MPTVIMYDLECHGENTFYIHQIMAHWKLYFIFVQSNLNGIFFLCLPGKLT